MMAQSNWLIARKEKKTWEAPHLINANHNKDMWEVELNMGTIQVKPMVEG